MIQYAWVNDTTFHHHAACFVQHNLRDIRNCTFPDPDMLKTSSLATHTDYFKYMVNFALDQMEGASSVVAAPIDVSARGWAGAALSYNRISEINGSIISALYHRPDIAKLPHVMEVVKAHKEAESDDVPVDELFRPILSHGKEITFDSDEDADIAPVLYKAYRMWEEDTYTESTETRHSNNIVIDLLNAILGTSGIFDMRENADIHPLAQLSALGKSMMESTMMSMGLGGLGMLAKKIAGKDAAGIATAGSALWGLSLTLIVLSMILFYILPFLPFLYFLFALSGWVKSIFEAMVAMPLWAIAHITIDGEGIPGSTASNGYFLLLEIFLRPILILFGLLASTIVFSSMVAVLNDFFPLILNVVGGIHAQSEVQNEFSNISEYLRSPVDELFYTAIYVILVYMIGLSCFKLIDLIPNKILRWCGTTLETFQESAGDPAGQMTQSVYKGGTLLTGKLKGGAVAALI